MLPPSGPNVPPRGEPPPKPSRQAVRTGAVAVAALVFVVGRLVWAYHLLQEGGRKPQQPPPVSLAPAPGARPSEPTSTPPRDTLPIVPGPWSAVVQALQGPAPLPLPVRVNRAIDRGLTYLRQGWSHPEAYQDYLGLVGLTLLECDVPRDDSAVRRIADLVRGQCNLDHTYDLCLAILFLDRLGDPKDDAIIRTFARRLLHGQNSSGAFETYCPLFRRPGVSTTPLDNNSNAQFAVLALWAAQRHGVSVGPALREVARHFRQTQHDDGSWPYLTGVPGGRLDDMTCAGLMCLAIERGASPGYYTRNGSPRGPIVVDDPAITRGFRFLGKACDRVANGGATDAWDWLYFLWSLERVAAVYGLETIGSRPWYPWVADLIVRRQHDEDGCWSAEGPEPVAVTTCFALLILRRSNLTPDLLVGVPDTTQPQQPVGVSTRPLVQDQPARAGSAVTQEPKEVPVPTSGHGKAADDSGSQSQPTKRR
jgi:hypothetical protein